MFQIHSPRNEKMKHGYLLSLAVAAGLTLAGCGGGTSDNYSESEAPGGYVIFNASTGNIPYPNAILIGADGDLNLTIEPTDSEGEANLKRQLNTLDGFSTTAPVTVGVSADVDPATLKGHVFVIDLNERSPLTFGVDYVASYADGKIAILPLRPLKGQHNYLIALTKGIAATDGKPIIPDYVTSLILSGESLFDDAGNPKVILDTDPLKNKELVGRLEKLRLLNTTRLIPATGLPAESILDIWTFKTQTIGAVAKKFVENDYKNGQLQLKDTGTTSKQVFLSLGYDVNDTMTGSAEIYAGALLNIPYYLGTPSTQDPLAPLHDSFRFENNDTASLPILTAYVSIPALAVVPNDASGCTQPDAGWPVVIYQHGITRNRTDLLALSEVFTNKDSTGQCFAAVAIDLPLHGVTDPANPFYVETNTTLGLSERTFNVDYVTEDAEGNIIAAQPDGVIDSSGIHYINLRSLLTSRDNIRQSTSDFVALVNALASAVGVKFDAANIHYVGHSLGAMAPFGFLTNHAPLKSVVLANYGGGIAQLLNHSGAFGPVIQQGLAAEGIAPGTPEYEAFMVATQTIIDDADPVNYAAAMPASGNRLLSFEVLDDQVIPNFVATAPLSGTDPMLRLENAQNIDTSTAPGLVGVGVSTKTVFSEGDHSSFLRPTPSAAATFEMWGETRSFVTTNGTAVLVQNPSVITER
jgi:pimeloyl-ACP methyl ester carboxylesterase